MLAEPRHWTLINEKLCLVHDNLLYSCCCVSDGVTVRVRQNATVSPPPTEFVIYFAGFCAHVHTLRIQLSPILGEAFKSNPLAQQMEELLQCGASCFVVVHLLLAALTRHAVHHPYLSLKTQLQKRTNVVSSEKGGKKQLEITVSKSCQSNHVDIWGRTRADILRITLGWFCSDFVPFS